MVWNTGSWDLFLTPVLSVHSMYMQDAYCSVCGAGNSSARCIGSRGCSLYLSVDLFRHERYSILYSVYTVQQFTAANHFGDWSYREEEAGKDKGMQRLKGAPLLQLYYIYSTYLLLLGNR